MEKSKRARRGLRATCAGVLTLAVAGCVSAAPPQATASRNAVDFPAVVARVKPVAEQACRARAPELNCNFSIEVLHDPGLQPNAYYRRTRAGRPRIILTATLFDTLHNSDELALILGHEAAHHIESHIQKMTEQALFEALANWMAAEQAGVSGSALEAAAQSGAATGKRRFSKSFELEADRIGAAIAAAAGYDPARGVAHLERVYDPGVVARGTHPSNAARIAAVRRH